LAAKAKTGRCGAGGAVWAALVGKREATNSRHQKLAGPSFVEHQRATHHRLQL